MKRKGTTTYNEVADELVAEFSSDPITSRASYGGYHATDPEPFDQKNIRRRVYDALNVLMAMNIISKEKKEIKWIGLPTNAAQELVELEQEKKQRLERISTKKEQLRDLLLQQIALKCLIDRNMKDVRCTSATSTSLTGSAGTGNAASASAAASASTNTTNANANNAIIQLPFIIINTDRKTVIECNISNDKSEYLFTFDNAFEIHDDVEVLKRMGLANVSNSLQVDEELYEKTRSYLPEALRGELDELIDLNGNMDIKEEDEEEENDEEL